MWLHASCALSFNVTIPTPMVLMLRPRSGPNQWVASEIYRLSPAVPVVEFTDTFGNLCQRLVAPVGSFDIHTSADVMVAEEPAPPRYAPFIEVPDLPDDTLAFLLPSRYCEADRLGDLAQQIAGDVTLGYAQVAAIARWVQNTIRYTPGSSSYPVSAIEVINRGEGVCRDLAQVGIALCRALCIPARLVVGYVRELDPMDVHAWFEAFVGDRWYPFDPIGDRAKGPRVAIAHGRDATDVAIYNQYGPPLLPQDMRVCVETLPGAP